MRKLSIVTLIALVVAVLLQINGNCFATNIPGSTNVGFANPNDITPSGSGTIWFVDGNSGSNGNGNIDCTATAVPVPCCTGLHTGTCPNTANTGKSPGSAFLTIGHALASAVSGDVIIIRPIILPLDGSFWFYNECLNINVEYLSLVSAGPPAFNGRKAEITCRTAATNSLHVTANGEGFYSNGLNYDSAEDGTTAPVLLDAGATFDNGIMLGSFNGTGPSMEISGSGGADVVVRNSIFWGGPVKLDDGNGNGTILENNTFIGNPTGPDITGVDGDALTVRHDSFVDSNKTTYVSLTAGLGTSGSIFDSDSFNTIALTKTNFSVPASVSCQNCSPNGAAGLVVSASRNTTSNAITTGGVTAFTASGDLDLTDIQLKTDGTGLAAGTNFQVFNGSIQLCSIAVSGLGANISKSCAVNGSMAPYHLADAGTLVFKCTGSSCTGAGVLTATVKATRAVPYASLTVN